MHRIKKQTFAAVFLLGMILGCQGEYVALFGGDSPKPLRVFPYRVAAFPPRRSAGPARRDSRGRPGAAA